MVRRPASSALLPCTALFRSASGICAMHAGNPCPGNNVGPNCNDSCSESAKNCSGNDASGTGCDDGLFCNGADTCNGSGGGLHAGNPCPGNNVGPNCNDSCSESAKNCFF